MKQVHGISGRCMACCMATSPVEDLHMSKVENAIMSDL